MNRKILAKFACERVTKTTYSENIEARPVTSGSEENETFSKETPSGKLELCITNKSAHGFFEPGKEYILTILEANHKETK